MSLEGCAAPSLGPTKLRLCRRPSKRLAFFGGYAIKAYARMSDEDVEAILKNCIWEED